MKTEKRGPGRPRKETLVIPRAKWGSKTRNGKPVIPSDGSLRPYINGVMLKWKRFGIIKVITKSISILIPTKDK